VDVVAVEEPLEIRLGLIEQGQLRHQAVSVTMRTPGNDFELAAGFLFTEGIITSPAQVAVIKHCGRETSPTNTVRVDLAGELTVDIKRLERNFYTTSSCGVCGKTSLEALATGARKVTTDAAFKSRWRPVAELPAKLRAHQQTFDSTGGLHASALFSREGELLALREDVGRHNAVDKLIGSRFLAGALPASDAILFSERPRQLRTVAESRDGRHPCRLRSRCAFQPGGRSRARVRRDPARIRARPALQRLCG
jgi:FdhD protein